MDFELLDNLSEVLPESAIAAVRKQPDVEV